MIQQSTQERYEIRVGVFTIIALILFLFGWGWLKSITWFHEPQRFTVQFHDIAGMNKNATVNINGVRVGVVENIELKAKGHVLVHPRITAPNIVVPRGSTVTIQTIGLVGAKYLEVTLPETRPGEPPPPPLGPDDVVTGEDPVRTELVINQVATLVKQMVGGGKGKNLANNFSQAVTSINHLANRIDSSMGHFEGAADSFSSVSNNAKTFFDQGKQTMQNVSGLTTDLRGTDQKLNKILDHPNISSDLKEVVDKAHKTSEQISLTVDKLNKMLGDDATRQDLITMMNKLSDSTNNIAHSMDALNSMSKDKDLRTDFKSIIAQARTALDKLNSVMGERGFGTDLHDTIIKVKAAATNVNIAAQQLQQALGQKHPMMHMMFGHGYKPQASSTTTTQKETNTSTDLSPSQK